MGPSGLVCFFTLCLSENAVKMLRENPRDQVTG